MLQKNLYWYSNIYGYQCQMNEKNAIVCLIMSINNWVSCPKIWVSRQKNLGELPKIWVSYPRIWVSWPILIWVSWFLGELSWYLSNVIKTCYLSLPARLLTCRLFQNLQARMHRPKTYFLMRVAFLHDWDFSAVVFSLIVKDVEV